VRCAAHFRRGERGVVRMLVNTLFWTTLGVVALIS
jgi:hypothetical protein